MTSKGDGRLRSRWGAFVSISGRASQTETRDYFYRRLTRLCELFNVNGILKRSTSLISTSSPETPTRRPNDMSRLLRIGHEKVAFSVSGGNRASNERSLKVFTDSEVRNDKRERLIFSREFRTGENGRPRAARHPTDELWATINRRQKKVARIGGKSVEGRQGRSPR